MVWCYAMPSGDKRAAGSRTDRAFDALRFGSVRTLNLRDRMPTMLEAETRVDAWLRQKQAEGSTEVLIITGRGVGSLDGVGKVREAVLRRCTALKRLNVVKTITSHGPGAFVVTVASMRELVSAPRLRTGRKTPTPMAAPDELAALPGDIQATLRELATLAIVRLGMLEPTEAMIADEMCAQFGVISPGVVGAADPVDSLRQAAHRLLQDFREA
jgi:hypothetical protein